MTFSRAQIQTFWTPLTLKLAQLVLTIFRHQPLITKEQKKRIKPFFIIGSGRSGTTLVRAILYRHPLIAIPPETYGLINSIKKYIRYNGLDWPDLVHVVIGEFISHSSFKYWRTDLTECLADLYRVPRKERSLVCIIDAIYQTYIKKHKPEAKIWGDKTPFNTLRLKWLKKAFPEAKYIHVLRDGRDVVSSYVKAGLLPSVEEACERWNISVDAIDNFKKKIDKSQMTTIRYEEMVKESQQNIKSLCNFLGIEFFNSMVENTEIHLGDEDLPHLKNVKNPINIDSIGKWKTDLNSREQAMVIKLIEDRMRKQGYRLD